MRKLLLTAMLLLGFISTAQTYYKEGVAATALSLEDKIERNKIYRSLLAHYTSNFVDANVHAFYTLDIQQEAKLSSYYITVDGYKNRIYQALLMKFNEAAFYKLATFDSRKLHETIKKTIMKSIVVTSKEWYGYYKPWAVELRDHRTIRSKIKLETDTNKNDRGLSSIIWYARKLVADRLKDPSLATGRVWLRVGVYELESNDPNTLDERINKFKEKHSAIHRTLLSSYEADIKAHKNLVEEAYDAMVNLIDKRHLNNQFNYANIEDYL